MAEAGASGALWCREPLTELLALESAGIGRYRSRYGDLNANGRCYGGQLLGQALIAAASDAPPARKATAMHLMFLQGALHDEPIDFEVTRLQDGKRLSSRHVRGTQGSGRIVLDAHASFATEFTGPEHGAAPDWDDRAPESLPNADSVPAEWEEGLRRLGGYSLDMHPALDFRLARLDQVGPDNTSPRLQFWLTARHALPDSAHVHAAAFAYLSDWWVNFACLGVHVAGLNAGQRLYISSLNHGVWFHDDLRADEWLHFDCRSHRASGGRGLMTGWVHNRVGRLVATVSQEVLMAHV